ncbi:hypothetical protein WA158_004796 [Blastocystis sp. Blastoise]
MEKGKVDDVFTCSICNETFKPCRQRKIGIMEECHHCFCMNCIALRRKNRFLSDAKNCPICGVYVRLVVPSSRMIHNDDEKNKEIHNFRSSCKKTLCPFVERGEDCPYSDCIYSHKPVKDKYRFLRRRSPTDLFQWAHNDAQKNYQKYSSLSSGSVILTGLLAILCFVGIRLYRRQ